MFEPCWCAPLVLRLQQDSRPARKPGCEYLRRLPLPEGAARAFRLWLRPQHTPPHPAYVRHPPSREGDLRRLDLHLGPLQVWGPQSASTAALSPGEGPPPAMSTLVARAC